MCVLRDPLLFLLDANACNALQQIDELNELEGLARKGVIELLYTETTWDEAQGGFTETLSDVARARWQGRRDKVEQFFFHGLPGDPENQQLQQPWRDAIAKAVFPAGVQNDNMRRDVEALLTVKMAGGFFVTRDGGSKTQPGGILGHKSQLAELGIEVLNFTEALALAKQSIN